MNNPYSQHPHEGNRGGRAEHWSADDNRGQQSWREDNSNRVQNRPSWNSQQGYGSPRYSANFSGQGDYDQGQGQWNQAGQNGGNYDDYLYRGNEFADQQRRSQLTQEYSPYSGQDYQSDVVPQTQPIRSDNPRWGHESPRNSQQPWQGRQSPATSQFGSNQLNREQEFWPHNSFNRSGQDYSSSQYGEYERSPYQSASPQSSSGQSRGAFGLEQKSHRGKGPKGYTRTDERIREDICECLSDDHLIDASEISVSVKDGVVTLEGSVFDRAQKYRAEDIADRCSGVKDVHNSLRVTQH